MKVEILVSTMHRSDMDIFNVMNIRSDALAVNQYDHEYKLQTVDCGNYMLRMISLPERGLSRSRNLAVSSSCGDICAIADDDLVYCDNCVEIITGAYTKYPDADIIAFDVPSANKSRPTGTLKRPDVNALRSMKLASFQLTFKRKSIAENNLRFNTFFGAGAVYCCGEENIFLIECLKKGLKIKYVNNRIATVDHRESTWFRGFNEAYFISKGAMFYQMSRILWFPLILQYAVRKYHLYRSGMSLISAIKYMFSGGRDYRARLTKGGEQEFDT